MCQVLWVLFAQTSVRATTRLVNSLTKRNAAAHACALHAICNYQYLEAAILLF